MAQAKQGLPTRSEGRTAGRQVLLRSKIRRDEGSRSVSHTHHAKSIFKGRVSPFGPGRRSCPNSNRRRNEHGALCAASPAVEQADAEREHVGQGYGPHDGAEEQAIQESPEVAFAAGERASENISNQHPHYRAEE